MVTATPGGKPLTSVAKRENGQYDSFASRKIRDCRQHCSAAVDVEESVLIFKQLLNNARSQKF